MATINYAQTPDQAFKTYQDYIQTGKQKEALIFLYQYFASYQSRNRRVNTYQDGDTSVASNISVLQKLMLSYIQDRLDVGVITPDDQNQLKEVFKSYRYMTQHQHADAFLEVLETYKKRIEDIFQERVVLYNHEELQKLPFVGQLNYEEPAEELLMLSFSPEQKLLKDQQKATLRLLWEAYRTIIENVKLNEKMEGIYFEVVRNLADYCLKYKRKAEFQWFIDQINKYLSELNSRDVDTKRNPSHVDLSRSATNDKHVNLRFDLARIAIQLEVWQDAYKLLESVLVLKSMRKGTFRASHMMNYFDLLSQIFQKSGNWLFQAFAYYNHFLAFKKKPAQNAAEIKAKQEEMQVKIDQLILRVLVVPIHSIMDKNNEKMNYLFQAKVPDQDELLKIISEANILEMATPVVRRVYDLLCTDQDLLSVASTTAEQFKKLDSTLSQFVPMLEDNLIMKVLQVVENIYNTVSLETLYNLLGNIKHERVEQNLLYANAHRHLNCQIDFVTGVVTFKNKIIERENQLLSNIFAPLQLLASKVNVKPVQKDLAKEALTYLNNSQLQMTTRSQAIKKQNRLNDPREYDKLQKEIRDKERSEYEKERREEEKKRQQDQERVNQMLQKQEKEIAVRRKILNDIIKLKGKRFVTFEIAGEKKKIEKIKDSQLLEIDTNVLQEIKKKFEEEAKKAADDKYVKAYKRIEYTERERRRMVVDRLAPTWEEIYEEDRECEKKHAENYNSNLALKNALAQAVEYKDQHFQKVTEEKKREHEQKLTKWRAQLRELFYEKVVQRAQELFEIDKAEKELQAQEEAQLQAKRIQEENEKKKQQSEQRENWRGQARPLGSKDGNNEKPGGINSSQYSEQPLARNTGQASATAASNLPLARSEIVRNTEQVKPVVPEITRASGDQQKNEATKPALASKNTFSALKNSNKKDDVPPTTENTVISRSMANPVPTPAPAPVQQQTQTTGFARGTNVPQTQQTTAPAASTGLAFRNTGAKPAEQPKPQQQQQQQQQPSKTSQPMLRRNDKK